MKVLVIGDLHGRRPTIPKLLDFDCIVLVGDICSDTDIGPLYKKYFRYLKTVDKDDFMKFEAFISAREGITPAKMRSFEKKSLRAGNKLLRYFDSFGKPMFMVAGNWDQSNGPTRIKDGNKSDYHSRKIFYDWYLGEKINPQLTKGCKNLHNCMYCVHTFKGVNFFGYGHSSGTESIKVMRSRAKKNNWTKKQLDKLVRAESRIVRKLRTRYLRRKHTQFPTFFISHNVPYNTTLDIIRDKKSYVDNMHLGSSIARDFCTRYKPLICMGGHIHENRGKDKIGKTLVVNTGFGKNSLVLIDIDVSKKKVKRIDFL